MARPRQPIPANPSSLVSSRDSARPRKKSAPARVQVSKKRWVVVDIVDIRYNHTRRPPRIEFLIVWEANE
eukprot:2019158-Rhodomonas_salina.5